jgi:arsenate reductase
MAEALLRRDAGDRFEAHSAGFKPGPINPLAVKAMADIGLDISKNTADSVFDLFERGELFSFVITVCRESEAVGCPIFPGVTERLHWDLPDPAALIGTEDEKLAGTIEIRREIEKYVADFIARHG